MSKIREAFYKCKTLEPDSIEELYIKELEQTRILDNQIITNLHAETVELKEALEVFCKRVEAGEVRSKKTYARFKELLEKYK